MHLRSFFKVEKIAAFAIALIIAACSETRVGGEYIHSQQDGVKSTKLTTVCNGGCRDFSASGSCVLFAKDLSPICSGYFSEVAQTNGDCSPIIKENRGMISLTYAQC